MIDMFIDTLLKESPALAVMLTMVILFIRYVAKRDELSFKMNSETNEIMRETAQSLGQVHEALKRMNGH